VLKSEAPGSGCLSISPFVNISQGNYVSDLILKAIASSSCTWLE